MLDYLSHDGFGSLLLSQSGIEVIQVVIIGIHEVNSCGVVDLVTALLWPLLVVHSVCFNLELPQALLQLDVIFTGASHSDDVFAELRQVALDDFG